MFVDADSFYAILIPRRGTSSIYLEGTNAGYPGLDEIGIGIDLHHFYFRSDQKMRRNRGGFVHV